MPTNNVSCNQNGPCYYWVLDPIDGTINFLHGLLSHSCVSLALVEVPKMAGECPDPLIGIIYHPTLKKVLNLIRMFSCIIRSKEKGHIWLMRTKAPHRKGCRFIHT